MDDKALAAAVAAAALAEPTKAKAGPFSGKLVDVLVWLRSLNVPWTKIFAEIPAIIAALSAGDWATVIADLIALFGLPQTTAVPAQPA